MRRILISVALVLLVSCKAQQISITNVEWKLVNMSDVDLSSLDQPVTLSFDEDRKRISGYAGCNHFFGTYQSKDATISFAGLGSTKMFCQDRMSVEDAYFKALNKVQSFKTSGGKLYFLVEGGVILEFSRQ